MDYNEIIEAMRSRDVKVGFCRSLDAADAIETLLAERDAAIADLTALGEDSGDSCHLCKHFPCVDENGNWRCLGFTGRGPRKGGFKMQVWCMAHPWMTLFLATLTILAALAAVVCIKGPRK